jgi:hypothetical protein
MASGRYAISPQGPANHAWVSRADTKFVSDGLYHVDITYEGEVAEEFRKKIDELVEEALAEHTKDMKPGEAKKWSAHYPYEIQEDPDTGAPTGRIIFKFKQNATIQMEDGTLKKITITVRDSQNNVTLTPVYAGDIIRVKYKPRKTVASSNKTAGIRLDFAACQIIAKKERDGGFGTVDDGYVDDHASEPSSKGNPANDGDY